MFLLFTVPDFDETDIEINNYDFVTTLYERYGKTLWKYAFKLSKSNETASDLVSTTYLKVIEKIETIKKIHSYKMKSYLMSIVKNTYLNYLNKEKSIIDIDNISEYSLCNSVNDFTEKIGVSEIEEALSHLPEPYKSILVYRYVYDEFSYEEIAIALNINVKNIRVYKKRALDMLKQRLKGGKKSYE
ncbi:MAG: sigma-70 family RNA polymerase sigma factor [Sedimentibacter sp.]|uniref:RNA polymerase sigma factor n=1 Tax=Sedimentibacter sp. TaxID=1960295 RepID=UPI0031587EDF